MKDIPSSSNENPKDSLDKDVADFQDWKKKYEENETMVLKEDLEKFENRPKPAYYSDTMKNSLRGESEQHTNLEIDQELDEMTGPTSISTDLLAAIADANGKQLPEERKQAVAKMMRENEGEIKNMRTGVMRDGKGIWLEDANKSIYEIHYE